MPIKSLVFDLGGVILNLSKEDRKGLNAPWAMYYLFDIPIEKAVKLWSKNCGNLVTGKESPENFLRRIQKKIGNKADVDELLKRWNKLGEKTPETIDSILLDQITKWRKTYGVYVLSDAFAVSQFDAITTDLRTRFDGYFVSYEQGYSKPNKDAYKNFLRKTNLRAEECVFIDDKEENVKGAEKVGMKAVRYTNMINLLEELKRLGINSD